MTSFAVAIFFEKNETSPQGALTTRQLMTLRIVHGVQNEAEALGSVMRDRESTPNWPVLYHIVEKIDNHVSHGELVEELDKNFLLIPKKAISPDLIKAVDDWKSLEGPNWNSVHINIGVLKKLVQAASLIVGGAQ